MGEFYPLFFENLSDSIPSVRQGAAISLGNVVKAYGKMKFYMIPFSRKRVNGYGCWVYFQFFQVQIPLKWFAGFFDSLSAVLSRIGHFWVCFSLYFKACLHAKSLLGISVVIHIEIIRANYCNKHFAVTVDLLWKRAEANFEIVYWSPSSFLKGCWFASCQLNLVNIFVVSPLDDIVYVLFDIFFFFFITGESALAVVMEKVREGLKGIEKQEATTEK